jgi:hypothetical protein
MMRTLTPEKLDTLDPTNPDALASRRDLVKINHWMGNYRWFESIFCPSNVCRTHCLEIGAGGGELAIRIIQKSCCMTYSAVDRAPQPDNWPQTGFWHQTDLFTYHGYATAEVLIANLTLHHFNHDELAKIGERIRTSSIRKIVANEPCRRSIHKLQLQAGRLIGFNSVTLHDGSVSIEAGFRADELPMALGLDPDRWYWNIEETFMGAYRMVAERR